MNYIELVQKCNLRPIRSQEQYAKCVSIFELLMTVDDMDQDTSDYCHVMQILIEMYEEATK